MTSSRENRLASEASPYLLQHARNPVDWWPWCPEALAEAKRRDVPILLSIGYSACHWCHVMERESFEDAGIAALMNERFVNIKVDREERPDLDQIYQLVVQLLGRNGGWPLTVFLTPDQEPFFGGTYFPPEDRHGMAGFPRVLTALSDAYRTERGEVVAQAKELTRAIGEAVSGGVANGEGGRLDEHLLETTSRALLRRFDAAHGGFGRAPKFPSTMPLEVLLRRGALEGHGPSLDAVRITLESMHDGGIWDQLGGGFHRYSTDERWLVPHFEKMLYDNALLLRLYAEAAVATGERRFRDVVHGIAGWLAREMTSETGAFFASQDADSEGHEGRFFVWDAAEIAAACGDDAVAARVAIDAFGVSPEGNFEDHGEPTGKTVLHVARPVRATAARLGMPEAEVDAALSRARSLLFAARERRPRPFRDEKILTSWNALMIASLAHAGAALGEPALLRSAERAMADVCSRLVRTSDGRAQVARLAKDALVKGEGFLDDHAYLACAALELYEATGHVAHLTLAQRLGDALLARFHEEGAGFFFTPKGGEALLARPSDVFDNAVPSGTSMACRALAKLGTLVSPHYGEVAAKELERLSAAAIGTPQAFGQVVCELDRLVRGSVDVVLVGPREGARALADGALRRYLPNRTVAWIDPADPGSRAAAPELAEGKDGRPGEVVAYVCRGRTCSLPVADPAALAALL